MFALQKVKVVRKAASAPVSLSVGPLTVEIRNAVGGPAPTIQTSLFDFLPVRKSRAELDNKRSNVEPDVEREPEQRGDSNVKCVFVLYDLLPEHCIRRSRSSKMKIDPRDQGSTLYNDPDEEEVVLRSLPSFPVCVINVLPACHLCGTGT